MNRFVLYASMLLLMSCSKTAISKKYQEKIAPVFSKENAFETVALMEKYWRIAGNKGFNESVYHIEKTLMSAGFIKEEDASDSDRLVYRVENRDMKRMTWEPVSGEVMIGDEQLLNFKTNRHMMALNSFSYEGDIEVIKVTKEKPASSDDVKGKLVYSEGSSYRLYKEYVAEKGAKGIIVYSMPNYLKPEINTTSIQFRSIPQNEEKKPFGIVLSYDAKQKLDDFLASGNRKISINIKTKLYKSEELTVVANMKGRSKPNQRFVYSAHIQEPGANDNATGVATLLEMAKTTAVLYKYGEINPARTITFLFGDEIISTRRYVTEDSLRAKGILWGMSLDMVGENTKLTGGTFLIEKMPDPSAIWTRGNDKHSEWGGRPLKKKDMMPHYFNDFVINRMKERAAVTHWVVNTNPFEGGSDHVPFLKANIPGLLLWHFTDQFYHTDQDRLDKVSPKTMENVGIGALSVAFTLTSDYKNLKSDILHEILIAAKTRLGEEISLSRLIMKEGKEIELQKDIISTWVDYYLKVFDSTKDLDFSVSDQSDVENHKTKFKQFINEHWDHLSLKIGM